MALTRTDIQKIALLARLALTPDEEERYAHELSIVLDYFAQLNEVDTDGVAETCQVTGLEDVVRPDTVITPNPFITKKIIDQFPAQTAGLLQVQAVFAGRMRPVNDPVSNFEE